MNKDTIVSQATPDGYSSVATIRISGTKSFSLAKGIAKSKKRHSHLSVALLPVFDKNNNKIDTAVFTFFKAPKSYTGEDVVEISCHGNPVICSEIIKTLLSKQGVRAAGPGEYTKRAFLNGKISLSQAESVALLISAKTKEAVINNLKNIEPTITEEIKKLKENLLLCASSIEYELDINEEEENTKENIAPTCKSIKNNILSCDRMLGSYSAGSAYNIGFRIAVVGKPNVGKSTLVNAIIGTNKSIVSETPGTTRDTVSSEIVLFGCPITVVDTAGIRNSSDKIEKEGVSRTMKEIDRSDLVLSVFCPNSQPIEIIEDKKHLIVYNKGDLQKLKNRKHKALSVSALKKTGIKKLINKIRKILMSDRKTPKHSINTERQRISLFDCVSCMRRSLNLLNKKNPELELAAFEIRAAINKLDVFLGKTTSEEILENVFSSFCVGK